MLSMSYSCAPLGCGRQLRSSQVDKKRDAVRPYPHGIRDCRLALAMLPVGTSGGGPSRCRRTTIPTSMHMAGSADMSMDDCCPDDMKGAGSHTDGYKCGMGFCCAGGTSRSVDVRALPSSSSP